ncbi:MAG: glycosyltransferase family 2 protein [Candidatus Gracilibacteria bacterium]|nr:glycosyltransferase family 2 protein [Candidatus Gracilibacteria bacterium]
MKVSIVLVNYNGKKFNIECLNSILIQNYQDFEIVFVDNNSSDNSLDEVEKTFGQQINNGKIKIIKNNINLGFTGGNNKGVKKCKGEYICLLNNDVTVPENWLQELIDGIQKDKSLGAIGSIILDKGYENDIKKLYFNTKLKIVSTHFGDIDTIKITENEIKNDIIYTNLISGCCFMYKKEIIDFLFPEFYFAYGEENFLSNVILLKGYKLGLSLKSFVNHYGSGSFGKKPTLKKVMNGTRNQLINFILFHSKKELLILFPLFITYHIFNSLFNYQHIRILGKIMAVFSFLYYIKNVYLLNQYINNIRKIDTYEFSSNFSYKLLENSYLTRFKGFKAKTLNIINNSYKIYFKIFKINKINY